MVSFVAVLTFFLQFLFLPNQNREDPPPTEVPPPPPPSSSSPNPVPEPHPQNREKSPPTEVPPPPPPSSSSPFSSFFNVAPPHVMNLSRPVPEPHLQNRGKSPRTEVPPPPPPPSSSSSSGRSSFSNVAPPLVLNVSNPVHEPHRQNRESEESPATEVPPPPPPSSSSPSPLQRQHSNSFLNVAPPHPLNLANPVPVPHRMDQLSWTALGFCFTAALAFNAIVAQKGPNNVSFRVHLLSVLFNIALHLLIAANAIFARTHPKMAYVMDRVGSNIVLIASIIAATPTISEHVSIGFAMFMIFVYAQQYLSSLIRIFF